MYAEKRKVMAEEKRIIANVFEAEGWIEKEEPIGSFFDDKPVVTEAAHGGVLNFSNYREGFWKDYHRHTCSHGIYVIEGKMKADDHIYEKGSFVWDPAGYQGGHGAAPGTNCRFLFISDLPFDIEFLEEPTEPIRQELSLTTANIYDEDGWTADAEDGRILRKALIRGNANGMSIDFLKLTEDSAKAAISLCGSVGIYVADGDAAVNNETYPTGTLLWYPEKRMHELSISGREKTKLLLVTVE